MTWGRSELRSFKRRSSEDYMDCDGDLAAAAAGFLNIFLSDSFWFVCRMRNRLAFPPFNATGWGSNLIPRPVDEEDQRRRRFESFTFQWVIWGFCTVYSGWKKNFSIHSSSSSSSTTSHHVFLPCLDSFQPSASSIHYWDCPSISLICPRG
jgi:hypothetical protein